MKFYKYFLYGVTFLTLPIAFSVFLYFNEKVFINNLTRQLVSDISENVVVNLQNGINDFVNINSLSAFIADSESDRESWRTAALSFHIQYPEVVFLWLRYVENNKRLEYEKISSEHWNNQYNTSKNYTFQGADGNFGLFTIPYSDNSSYWVMWDFFPDNNISAQFINLDFLYTPASKDIKNIENGKNDGKNGYILTEPTFLRVNNRMNFRVLSKNIFTFEENNVKHIGLSYVPVGFIGNSTCDNLIPGIEVYLFSNDKYLYGCKKESNHRNILYTQKSLSEKSLFKKDLPFLNDKLAISRNIQVNEDITWEIVMIPSEEFKISSIVEIVIPVSIILIIFIEILIFFLIYKEKQESKKNVQNVIKVETQLIKHICHEILNPLHSVKYYVSVSKCKCNVDLINENLSRMSDVIDSYKHNDDKIDVYKKCNIATIIRDITSQIENLKIRIHENVWCDFITYPYIIKRFLIYIFLIYKLSDFLHFEANVKDSKLSIDIKLKSKPKNLDFHEFNKTLEKVEGKIIKDHKTIKFTLPVQLIEENV